MIYAKNMAADLYRVFVYGTLKQGEPNHSWFSKAEKGFYKFICNAQTIEKYPLIIATSYNIPFLLYSPGKGHYVRGEIYEVNDIVLKNLDILEDHPNYYVREQHEFHSLSEKQETLSAWVYFIKNFKIDLLHKTMMESYSSKGSHGLKYVSSEESSIDDLNK